MEMESKKEKNLPIPEGKISYLRMEPASNGIIISYDVTKKSSNKGTFDNCGYENEKEVFDFDTDSEEGLNEAFDRYKQLWIAAYKRK